MKAITAEWLKAAESDILLIKEILHNDALTHLAAFHAQQAIEKCFKAILEERLADIPKIHNLKALLKRVEALDVLPDIDNEIIEQLDLLYIESRYPGEFGLLPNGKPTVAQVKEFYESAKLIFEFTVTIVGGGAR